MHLWSSGRAQIIGDGAQDQPPQNGEELSHDRHLKNGRGFLRRPAKFKGRIAQPMKRRPCRVTPGERRIGGPVRSALALLGQDPLELCRRRGTGFWLPPFKAGNNY